MQTITLYLGLDVHMDSTTIAIAEPGSKGEIRLFGCGSRPRPAHRSLHAPTVGKLAAQAAVQALMAFRGFQLVVAMITVSELGDIHRFEHPRQLMTYLGLVPNELIAYVASFAQRNWAR